MVVLGQLLRRRLRVKDRCILLRIFYLKIQVIKNQSFSDKKLFYSHDIQKVTLIYNDISRVERENMLIVIIMLENRRVNN